MSIVKETNIDTIAKEVGAAYGREYADMYASRRKQDSARKITIYLAKVLADSTDFDIGKKFGISPTGVSMAVKRIEAVIKTDKRLKRKVEKFIKKQNIA